MGEGGHRESQGLVEQNLARGRLQQVGERDDALIIDAKAEGRAAIVGLVFPALLLCQVPARSRVARTLVLVWGAGSTSNLCAAAITWVDQPPVRKALQVASVHLLSFALRIWRIRTTNIRPFIPIQTQPAQVAEHALGDSWAHTRSIQVFDTQHELSACAASEEPRQQRRAQVAQVEVAGGTGRVATTYQTWHFCDHGQPDCRSWCPFLAITGNTSNSESRSTSTQRGRPT